MKPALTVLFAIRLSAACVQVQGGSILARDLGEPFTRLRPGTEIGAAPIAGVERVLFHEDLLRLARKFGLPEGTLPASICFEQAVHAIEEETIKSALTAALPPGAQVEILEISRTPVPPGTLQFTRGGLEPSGLWRGRVLYAPGRSVNTWARVRVTEQRTWIEAAEVLPAGQPIRAEQLVENTGEWPLLDAPPIQSISAAVGAKPVHILLPGTPLKATLVRQPPQVARGEKVSVEVSEGGALLAFEAEAETSGSAGDLVFLRNPASGQRFQAKVEGKRKVGIRK